jgi:nitrite reductase (NO-forming)
VISWVTWQVHRTWKTSINRRFAVTGTFYRLAAMSLLLGASIGGALGVGAFDDGASYIAHRGVHMTLNVFGWAGMTIVGTAITLLPTILHVRSPNLKQVRSAPWLMFGGLVVMSTGATTGLASVGGAGMAVYVAGLAAFGSYVRAVVKIPRRRRVPTAALHLVAAMTWAVVTACALCVALVIGDDAAARDLVVVGGAAGFAVQALLGAWSFLLPSTRPPVPQRRRLELSSMELGGRTQVIAYNAGLLAVIIGLLTGVDVSLPGIAIAWTAALWAMTKSWTFPLFARLPAVGRLSSEWWANPG